jgi:NADP-dependent aldehyde dehydrogenase
VLPQALRTRTEALADALAASVSLGNGQFCTSPGLVLAIQGEGYAQFRERLMQQLALKPAQPMLSPTIAATYRDGLATLAAQAGVDWLLADRGAGNATTAAALETSGANLLRHPALAHEVFGPATLLVHCADRAELLAVIAMLEGQLTATIQTEVDELADWPELPALLARKAGRVLFGGMPTGVEVGHATVHGGPYPACSDSRSTSVGSAAIARFARPVCYQDWPDHLLPPALQADNPLRLWRHVDR